MTDTPDSASPAPMEESGTKKKKAKKRPSDFEIARTILTRSHERKLPWLLKDMGEHNDILFFCSQDEEGFTYGSPDIAVAIFEFTDPELKSIMDAYLGKLHGYGDHLDYQRIINVRDQISELVKTKGESMEVETHQSPEGSVWTIKKDVNGNQRNSFYCKYIESLFHMQLVKSWCDAFRPLLTTDDANHLYYPYTHPEGNTASLISLPTCEDLNHPIGKYYPHGFRTMVTRGMDVILGKFLTEDFPYPILKDEFIVFQDQAIACQLAHRVIAEGWRMILIRPNAVYFPTLKQSISKIESHRL